MNKEKLRIFLLDAVSSYGADRKMRKLKKGYGADCSDIHRELTDRIHAFYEKEEILDRYEVERQLTLFAHEVLKDVAVQTHTDFEKYLEPITMKYLKLIK